MTNDDTSPYLDGKPSGHNCRCRYPWTIKGRRDYFSADIVRSIDISMDQAFASGPVPPSSTSATKARLFSAGRIVDWNFIMIQKTGLAGVALFITE